MKPRAFVLLSVALFAALPSTDARAATPTNPPAPAAAGGVPPPKATPALSVGNDADAKTGDAVKEILARPGVFSTFITGLTNAGWTSSHSNAVFSLLKELHLRPKVFHTRGASDAAALGLEYDFNKSIQNKTFNEGSINPIGLSFDLSAKGTITQDAKSNPDNFLESELQLHLFQALGGMTPQVISGTNELRARAAARKRAAEIKREDFRNDPAWLDSGREVMKYCRPQFGWDLAGRAALEADQEFKNKQWVYGGRLRLVYQDWADVSPLNWLNVLDLPFAALRSFTIPGEPFRPSGQAFPMLLGGLDLVDPGRNADRLKADPDDQSYVRLRAEVAFKTQVTHLFGGDIWLSASYRYFRETGASRAIRAAELDVFNYLALRLDLPKGFNVNYSTGKLPLDRKADQVYAIGYTLNF